jgi:sugar-specific transcriptional regulator TrmB
MVVGMALEEREIAALRRLGLTEYECRLYLALVKMGPVKASEVSFFGQVPRTKAYGAISDLQQKGLVKVVPGKPEIYEAASPTEVLAPIVKKMALEINESQLIIEDLALAYESNKYVKRDTKMSEESWHLQGRQVIYSKLNEVISEASKSVNYSTSAIGLVRAYKAHAEAFERAKKQGATVRLLSPINSTNSSIANEFSAIAELKKNDEALPFFVSVDSKHFIVVESRPEDASTDRGYDEALWTTNKLVVELFEQLFDRVWKHLPSKQSKSSEVVEPVSPER